MSQKYVIPLFYSIDTIEGQKPIFDILSSPDPIILKFIYYKKSNDNDSETQDLLFYFDYFELVDFNVRSIDLATDVDAESGFYWIEIAKDGFIVNKDARFLPLLNNNSLPKLTPINKFFRLYDILFIFNNSIISYCAPNKRPKSLKISDIRNYVKNLYEANIKLKENDEITDLYSIYINSFADNDVSDLTSQIDVIEFSIPNHIVEKFGNVGLLIKNENIVSPHTLVVF